MADFAYCSYDPYIMKLEYLFAVLLIAFGTFAVSYGIINVTSKSVVQKRVQK